jgi:hypothetical protein
MPVLEAPVPEARTHHDRGALLSSTYMTAEEAARITTSDQAKPDPIWKSFLIGGRLGFFSLYWVVKNLRNNRIGWPGVPSHRRGVHDRLGVCRLAFAE